jgi:hypothetical protein
MANFFVYLFTFPLFLSIEVGGDEHAGSKLEVPCPFFGTWGFRRAGTYVTSEDNSSDNCQVEDESGSIVGLPGILFRLCHNIRLHVFGPGFSHTAVFSSPSSGGRTNLTRPRVITHHLEVNFWQQETMSGHQKNEGRWDSHTSSLGHTEP